MENITLQNGVCSFDFRIYYEDTDAAGVVYYGNYLRYYEWGRTEYLRLLKLPLSKYLEEDILFVVSELGVKYRSPAHYNDLLTLETRVAESGRCHVVFSHILTRKDDQKLLNEGTVKLVSVNGKGKPVSLPDDLKMELGV